MTSRRIEPNNQGDDRHRLSLLLGSRVDENMYCRNGFSNEFLFQEERIALYHGEPQYYYDVPTQTEECEYDGDGEQKSDTEKSLYEESDNDGDTGDFDTDSSLYDEDNDAMLEDDNFDYNFNDNADTPKTDIQVEDLNMDEKQYNSDELHSPLNFDEEGHGRRCKEFNVDTDMENSQFG
ncbi:hypothetical protein ACFX1X_036158 [Malus domestica]